MTQFFLECTIRAALIVGATALVLYAMRVKVASVKHRVWTAVLQLMLALPLWIAWGPKAPIRILPANVQNFAADVLIQPPATAISNSPKTDAQQAIAPSADPIFSLSEALLLSLYFFGTFIFLARLTIGTWKARRLIRQSLSFESFFAEGMLAPSNITPIPQNKEISRHPEGREATRRIPLAFLSRTAEGGIAASNRTQSIRISSHCAAPVTIGCFRPTILLPSSWREWSMPQVAAVLAHEGEHARRRDPLIQWLALFNRAIFWFHPAAWWLERELSALAEECCDAAVLAQGHDPGAYAETLMQMARAVMHSGSRINATGTAMPGPRLPQRIRAIIEDRSFSHISRMRIASVIAACVAICGAFVAVTLTRAQSSNTLAWEKAAGGKISFEVASVKPNDSGPTVWASSSSVFGLEDNQPSNGVLRATNVPLITYIAFAYKLDVIELKAVSAQLPQWTRHPLYDIEAQAPSSNFTKDQVRLMMQSLLAERFKLAVHFETKDGPAYALVLSKPGKLGSQLQSYPDGFPCSAALPFGGGLAGLRPAVPTVDDGRLPASCGKVQPLPPIEAGMMHEAGRNLSMDTLLDMISTAGNLDRPLVNRTGLSGTFDVSVEFSRAGVPSAPLGTTFLEAISDQLGLKLESVTAPVSSLVVDHIEEPTPN